MWIKSIFTTPTVATISFCLIGGPTPAYAQCDPVEVAKLLASDGAEFDQFGNSVAICSTTAIVGAPEHDDNGSGSGAAYLFEMSDPNNPVQVAKLLSKDGAAGDSFGWSVAISGTTVVVGAYLDDDNGFNSGSAYLFDITVPNKPAQITKLLPDDGAAGDFFGWSVAISPDGIGTVIVGAPHAEDDNGIGSGAAYLFDISDPNNPAQIAKFLPGDGAAGDFFGWSVAISSDGIGTAMVGAILDDDNGINSGSAYLFDITTGQQLFKFLPDDGAALDEFGFSVVTNGTTAIVGARNHFYKGGDYAGSAYLFDTATGEQISKLQASDGATGHEFGFSVAISSDSIGTAIVGARLDNDNGFFSGSAYLFDISDPATPMQIAKFLPNDGAAFDEFGISVAISGETAIVGARFSSGSDIASGSAYLFDAAAPDATLFFEPDQSYLSEADSPLDTDSAGFILENFEDGLFNIPGVSVSGGEVRFPGPFTDSVDLDDGVPDGFGTDGHSFLRSDGQTGITFTFDAKVLGQLPTQAGLVWTDGNPQAVVTFTAEDAQGICVVETQVTLGDGVNNGTTAEDRFLGVAFADGIGALTISASVGGFEVDHVQFLLPCPWDLDDNGTVGASDLLSLLASWGPCKGCPADFDGSGSVGASDLLALLANWGPCP